MVCSELFLTGGGAFSSLSHRIVTCRRCPRLREYCGRVAVTKRRAFLDWDYWGRPVPGWGDTQARLLIIGLAPAAHGANRTGRMFTGDSSGDFLYRTLWKFGFADRPESRSRHDGLTLKDCFITAAGRCAPPQNSPSAAELANCLPFLAEEIALLSSVRVVVGLGTVAWQAYLKARRSLGRQVPQPLPRFGHLAEVAFSDASEVTLLGSFHPSRQNTQTGRLTPAMFEAVFERARNLLGDV